jgi:hypothetical protein
MGAQQSETRRKNGWTEIVLTSDRDFRLRACGTKLAELTEKGDPRFEGGGDCTQRIR